MTMEQVQKNLAESILKMHHIVCDEISFKRVGFCHGNDPIESEISISISKKNDTREYRVSLRYSGEKRDEYSVCVQITGYFEVVVDGETNTEDQWLEKNAVAILFPFLRSELTLITTQPETTPIVLPVMNINAMMDEAKKEDDDT